MLSALVGAVNNDTTTLSEAVGFSFPKHMSEDVCTYMIVGTGYFDCKGRDGLIQIVKSFLPDTHYLYAVVKDSKYKDALERLSTLRNYATHQSKKSKKAAAQAIGAEKLGTAGSWLQKQGRFAVMCDSLKKFAHQ